MTQTIHDFNEKLRKDIKDEMKATTQVSSSANYERVLLLLKVAHKFCETKHFLIGEEEMTAARSAVGSSSVLPL